MKGKWLICTAAVLAAALLPANAKAAAAQPEVSAKSAVVVNADDGRVLYAKNGNQRLAIASTTKIMTSMLTLQAAEVENRTVTITPEMIRVEGSSMGLRAGDRLTLRDLAAGMLMVSGNDAANSAAFAVGGTKEHFADMMNAEAARLGMKNTHFVTPSGLDDEEHYSTAYDMSQLTCAAMKNSDFSRIVRQSSMEIHFVSPDVTHYYGNHNRLLKLYRYCTGVKTGFTKKAGRCLVSAAEKDGVRLVAVTLNAPDDWNDHVNLLNYGFTRLKSCTIDDSMYHLTEAAVGGVKNSVAVVGSSGGNVVIDSNAALQRTVEMPRFVYAPVKSGQVLGRVCYRCDGKLVAATELTAAENISAPHTEKNWFQNFAEWFRSLFQ